MAPNEVDEQANKEAKDLFFNQLMALGQISDEEEDANQVREIIRRFKKPRRPPSIEPTARTSTFKTFPALRRTTSVPVSSISFVKETPTLPRYQSLLCTEITTSPASFDSSVVGETPFAPPSSTNQELRRVESAPSIGTDLVLKHSTGIESMLGKKPLKRKKSKETMIKLVPENERIFKGLTFYYVSPDDISPIRRFRITKAREYGAVWAGKYWIPGITHVIVDKDLNYKDVMAYLKLQVLPPNVLMVNENYPIDCTQYKLLLNPMQFRYAVEGQQEVVEKETAPPPPVASLVLDKSLEIKASKLNPKATEQTPSQSQDCTQTCNPGKHPPQMPLVESPLAIDSPPMIWLAQDREKSGSRFLESPQDSTFSGGEFRQRQESTWPGDELDEMIKVARRMEHLPVEDEDDDTESDRPSSRDDPDDSGSDDEARSPTPWNKGKRKETSFNQENFSCMTGGTGVTLESNPNARTIEVLQEMTEYYIRTKDHWRQTAYRKVMSTLKRQTNKISTYEEAIILPTVGHRLALKIEEIALTDCLRRLESAKLEAHDHVLQTFMNIYGVGLSQGWRWVQQGHKTLDDLLSHVKLTDSQRLGIQHYDEFLTHIPRDEVTALGDIVRRTAEKLDPEVQVVIGGSYRRGAATSGDIDCLLTKPNTSLSRDLLPFLNSLVDQLTHIGFLVAALAVPSETGSASKWHGCCVIPGSPKPIWRRIDLLLVPETELGAALIYFTGDDIFNRSIRLLSSRKGWRLNQRGLFKDVMRGPGRLKMNEGALIEGSDEKKIFAALGVPWRPPEQRICH